jgi:hypothetical protein
MGNDYIGKTRHCASCGMPFPDRGCRDVRSPSLVTISLRQGAGTPRLTPGEDATHSCMTPRPLLF